MFEGVDLNQDGVCMGNFGGESDDPFAFVVSNHTFYIPNGCVIPEWPISVSHRPVVHEGGGVGGST